MCRNRGVLLEHFDSGVFSNACVLFIVPPVRTVHSILGYKGGPLEFLSALRLGKQLLITSPLIFKPSTTPLHIPMVVFYSI